MTAPLTLHQFRWLECSQSWPHNHNSASIFCWEYISPKYIREITRDLITLKDSSNKNNNKNNSIKGLVFIDNSEMEDRVKKMADLKNLRLENQKLLAETLKLTWRNQTLLEINNELYLAKLQAENQKLTEEVLTLAKKNNASLKMQSELYKKMIEAKEAIFSSQSIDTNVELDEEEIPESRSKRIQKVKS